jgi:hypothetical protein
VALAHRVCLGVVSLLFALRGFKPLQGLFQFLPNEMTRNSPTWFEKKKQQTKEAHTTIPHQVLMTETIGVPI